MSANNTAADIVVSGALYEWSKEDLIFLISTLKEKLERKEATFQRNKKSLESSRSYNGKLKQKVMYLQSKIVDYHRDKSESKASDLSDVEFLSVMKM